MQGLDNIFAFPLFSGHTHFHFYYHCHLYYLVVDYTEINALVVIAVTHHHTTALAKILFAFNELANVSLLVVVVFNYWILEYFISLNDLYIYRIVEAADP